MYLGLWYRAAVTGADGAGAHLLDLASEDTEELQPADFERRRWRVRGGGRGNDGTQSSELSLLFRAAGRNPFLTVQCTVGNFLNGTVSLSQTAPARRAGKIKIL
jgi:hypothetical protein